MSYSKCVLLTGLLLVAGCNLWRRPSAEEIKQVKTRVEATRSPRFVADDTRDKKAWDWTKHVYTSRQFRPVWSTRGRMNPATENLVRTLSETSSEGLHPEAFALTELRSQQESLSRSKDVAAYIDFDLRLTHALMRYARQLCFGRIDARDIAATWRAGDKECDGMRAASEAIDRGQFDDLAQQLAPKLPEYRILKEALKQYNDPAARERIEVNLDRLRWVPHSLEPRHIRVNVPAFELSVHEGRQIPLESRVIVGSDENRTPIIRGEMQYLVFSPYWNVPLSIATKEFLPKIKENPRFLERQQMEVVRSTGSQVETIDPSDIDWDQVSEEYQLRQRPGASNALGLVKFIFPNPFNIYLHDTPADNLFDRLTRTLSHGCIRVERASELAAYVLKDQPEWTPERIATAMHSREEKRVNLRTPLPVHILYWTAWVDSNGAVQFSKDVYGYDQKHIELSSPAAHSADIHVNEVGRGIVPNAAGFH